MVVTTDGATTLASFAPVDQRAVRRANLGVVLQHAAARGPLSRARIAAETGLNKTTVSSLVAELVSTRLLQDGGDDERSGLVGRPAQTVRLNPDGAFSLGLEIHFDYLSACATDLTGTVRYASEVAVNNRASDPTRVLDRLAELAGDALDAAERDGLPAVGVTIAAPGLVDVAAGVSVASPDLDWKRVPIVAMLAERLDRPGLPVRADNESNLGALAELWAGAGRGLRDFVYVSSPHGVGAGIVLHGELYRGAHGFAGELGHVTVDPEGPQCTCGSRGCLAMLVGEDALMAIAADHGLPASTAPIAARALAARIREGDADTAAAVERVGRWLGIGLADMVNLLDPEAVVLGGCLGVLAEWLQPPLREALSSGALATGSATCRIVPSRHGEAAAVHGAAALALREVIADPTSIRELLRDPRISTRQGAPRRARVRSLHAT
jgi:predicted NBD/HSP70 family sugar kinase